MTAERTLRLETLAYGGDYNPEQWPEHMWADDVRLMRESGVNFVTLPVFSWSRLEPYPGEFDFEWLDRIIDMLWGAGIAIDLATATATPPAWLVRANPELLPHNADGVRLEFGSRQAYCPSSPVFREHVARFARVMANRYGSHPAVRLWHVSNEYGDHVSRCWCPTSAAHFRRWLQEKYDTLDGLNEAWGTSCWGQTYISWEHIEPPRTSMGPVNPTQQLDFERFSSNALLELFRIEVDVLREVTPDLPVTTNFMSLFRELNYWDFAAHEDLVTDDAYPDPADPRAHVGAALNYGLMRSLKGGKPWLLLEQAPSAVSWRDVNVPKAPGQMRIMSLHALAHGSDGAMVFQWRQARFGPEKFHSAMLGHRGERSRTYREAAAFGNELQKLAPIKGSRVHAQIALVVDWDSWWGLSAPDSLPSLRLDWLAQARSWHAALYDLGHTIDAVKADGPFEQYRVVVVPNLYLTTTTQAAALLDYVRAGGTIVVGPFSGVVDTNDTVYDGGAPGPLRELLGIEVDEWWPIPDGDSTSVVLGDTAVTATVWSEWLETHPDLHHAAHYASGELDSRPALTRRSHGSGSAWYLSTCPEPAALRKMFDEILAEAGIYSVDVGERMVEIVTRTNGVTDYVFLLNHGTEPVVLTVAPGALNLLSGETTTDTIHLDRYGAAVLVAPKADRLATTVRLTPVTPVTNRPEQETTR